jgi:hypothetical protein
MIFLRPFDSIALEPSLNLSVILKQNCSQFSSMLSRSCCQLNNAPSVVSKNGFISITLTSPSLKVQKAQEIN